MNTGVINPVLRYNRSPLTIALVKYNHTINDNHEPARPSSCFHSGHKQNQTKILKYGVIYHGVPLFKEVQDSCVECEMKWNKPFKVKMGPMISCMFDKIQLFNFMSIDVKGPMILKGQKQVHILVAVCLQTKYTELIHLDKRSTTSFLSVLNIIFSLYGVPSLLLSDKEGVMTKLYNNINKINERLMVDQQIEISLIPAFLHHFRGSVEAKIRQLGSMLGSLNLESNGLTETEFSNTLRILSNFLNKQPYHIQFCSNVDKGTASGLEYTTSEIEFIAS